METKATNKWVCVVAYLGILFFIPLLVDSNNQDYKFHANQGLLLLIFSIAANMVGYIPFIGWIVAIAGAIAGLVFMIMGVVNAINSENKELPIIGQYRLIK